MNRTKFFVFSAILSLSYPPLSLLADIVVFRSGKTLENVKTRVHKETVDILYENGKQEVKNKSELKGIKLKPVTWNETKSEPEKKETKIEKKPEPEKKETKIEKKPEPEKKETKIEKKPEEEPSKTTTSKIEIQNLSLEEKLAVLEEERELNYAVPEKILEERRRQDFLMKERVRLQYTEGLLTYAGGQNIYSEIMVKINDRYYVRNKYGLLYFTANDFGEDFVIETDNGKERIDVSKMLAVKEEKYLPGYIYLSSGERVKGKIEKTVGDTVTIASTKGEMKISAAEILFPKIPKEETPAANTPVITIKEGEYGQFIFGNGQVIKGKLVKLSKNYLAIETIYGILELDPSDLVSATKEEPAK